MSLSLVFNPVSGTFDYVDSGTSVWGAPVPDLATLQSITTDVPYSVRVVEDTTSAYCWDGAAWNFIGLVKQAIAGSSPNAQGYSVDAANTLTLQPADGTHPGIISTTAQTLAGNKTFSSAIYAAGGVDLASTGTLAIGTSSNTTTINIGNAGATVNIQGTVITETTTTLNVTNPVFTVNSSGSAGSASNSGMQVEEGGGITGYVETSGDRNSWILKAPNTAGIATVTPGSSGIVLAGSITNGTNSGTNTGDITLNAVGSSPNANGASLSGQALTLQPANVSNPGVVTTAAQTFAGNKTFNDGLTMSNSLNLNGQSILNTGTITFPTTSDMLVGRATTDTLTNKTISGASNTLTNISLTSAVTGVLPVGNGGTGANTTPANGAIPIGNGTNYTVATMTAGSGITITNSAGSITIAETVPTSTGDIAETTFSLANNQTPASNVTGLAFSNASVRAASVQYYVYINATASLYETGQIQLIQKASSWDLSQTSSGDNSLVTFSITSAGQIQYTSANYAGFVSGKLNFRARALGT